MVIGRGVELPDQTTTVWREWVGPTQWRLDLRGWRILGLDDADATLSPESMELVTAAAAEPAPRGGTILVAHRPLAAPTGNDDNDGVAVRARRIAATGLVPTLTFSGHWHENNDFRDAAGTRHILQGENCDRSSNGPNPPVTAAILTLGDGPPVYDTWRIPRRVRLSDQFLRHAVGSVYPSLRGHVLLTFAAVAALLVAAAFAGRAALRRAAT